MDVSDIMEFRVFIEVFSKEIYAFRYDPMLSNFLAEMRQKMEVFTGILSSVC